MTARESITVILASAGRPDILAQAILNCNEQTGVDFCGVVSVPDTDSLPSDQSVLSGWRVVTGVRGLAAQRNHALDTLENVTELVYFFDDDAVLRHDYLYLAARHFRENPEVVGATGRVLLDGKTSEEIHQDVAVSALRDSEAEPTLGVWRPTRELYGANFGYRLEAAPTLRFDDRLPLYSWLEDHDFARRLMPLGVLAHVDDCIIVHRAAASGGRKSHLRLGYSQVANPIYLWRKGSFPLWLAAQQLGRPVAKNIVRSVGGGERIWRRGRLRGNVLAVKDLLRARLDPKTIVDL